MHGRELSPGLVAGEHRLGQPGPVRDRHLGHALASAQEPQGLAQVLGIDRTARGSGSPLPGLVDGLLEVVEIPVERLEEGREALEGGELGADLIGGEHRLGQLRPGGDHSLGQPLAGTEEPQCGPEGRRVDGEHAFTLPRGHR